MCAKIPSNVKLSSNFKSKTKWSCLPAIPRSHRTEILLGAAATWLAGGSCKSDFVEVLKVLIDITLGVVGTSIPEVLLSC
jgi:hypothetical protein